MKKPWVKETGHGQCGQRSVRHGGSLRLAPLIYLCLLIAARASAARPLPVNREAGDEATKKEVLNVENQLNQAMLKADVKMLDSIYADDFAYTNAGGESFTRAQVLDAFGSGTVKLLTLGRGDIQLYVFGNTVILNGISGAKLEYKGKLSYGPRRFTNVYVKIGGRWRLAAHSVSNFPKK